MTSGFVKSLNWKGEKNSRTIKVWKVKFGKNKKRNEKRNKKERKIGFKIPIFFIFLKVKKKEEEEKMNQNQAIKLQFWRSNQKKLSKYLKETNFSVFFKK